MGCELLNSGEEVVGDYIFKWSVKSLLFLSLLDGFSGFIILVFLIFSHLTNIRDVFKD